MLSYNLKLPRKEIKRSIGFYNNEVWFKGRPFEITLGLTSKLVCTSRLKISLAGHLGRRLKTFLEAVYDRHGRWASNQQMYEFFSDECWIQGDRPQKGRMFTFVVPCPTMVCGDFKCKLLYSVDGWRITEIIGGTQADEIVNMLARGLDLRGWRLPNHWYQSLFAEINALK